MRLMCFVGLPLSVVVVVGGIILTAAGDHHGVAGIIVGSILLGVWSIAIPFARRQGKV